MFRESELSDVAPDIPPIPMPKTIPDSIGVVGTDEYGVPWAGVDGVEDKCGTGCFTLCVDEDDIGTSEGHSSQLDCPSWEWPC